MSEKRMSRYQREPNDADANALVTRAELFEAQDALRETEDRFSLRTKRTDYLYRQRGLSQNQRRYLERYWKEAIIAQNLEELTLGQYGIARRMQRVLGHRLDLEGCIEHDQDHASLRDALPDLQVYCGPASCGKTFHSREVAAELGIPCIDTDIFHRWRAIQMMMDDKPLNDDLRAPYFDATFAVGKYFASYEEPLAIAFPAHTQDIRSRLRKAIGDVVHIRFEVDEEELLERAQSRPHPYIRKSSCKKFIANQVQINTPITPEEMSQFGDIEIDGNKKHSFDAVRAQLRKELTERISDHVKNWEYWTEDGSVPSLDLVA